VLTDEPSALAAAALLVAILTWSRPVWAVALLLAGLPFVSHHPAAPSAFRRLRTPDPSPPHRLPGYGGRRP